MPSSPLPLTCSPLREGWELRSASWPAPPEKLGFSRMEWLPARVPGHVHLDLMASKVLADPFVGLQELAAQWVDDSDWLYRTRFVVEPATGAVSKRRLRFEALDTVCRVSIDGKERARHDNMFVPLELDIGDLQPGEHELLVHFESAARVGQQRRARYFEQHGLPSDTVRFDERAFVRKSQYMFGWDWGPRLVSVGIADAVSVLQYTARILDVHVEQRHDEGRVELCIRTEVEGDARAWHFVEGQSRPFADGERIELAEPRLWWPRGFGQQHRYGVTTLVCAGNEPPLGVDAAAFDRRTTQIGLRTLSLVQTKDRYGQSFEFEVNGRPLYALGANWIPDHSFPSAITNERLRTQLERACDLGMNMLRIWGGGLYESDAFYDLCDELGLLVWQDFAYACSYYPDDDAARAVAEAEARANVRRLRNHPSLALWCGNNENHEMFDKGWDGRDKNPPRFHGESIYHEVLARVVGELDPERPYLASSPLGGEHPSDGGFGDQHYWDVWHGRGDWKFYEDSTARFSSEFGFASACGRRAWQHIDPAALGLDVRDPVARWHDKTLKGYDTFVGYVELHYPQAANVEEWLYTSQLNQRDALRHGIEHYRRSEFCKGSLIWQLNDCWPVQSWAVIDFAGDYKAAAYEMRRLHAPALGSIVLAEGQATLFAVLDNAHSPLTAPATLQAVSLSQGRVIASQSADVTLQPTERKAVLELDTRAFAPADTLIHAEFAGTTTFRLLAEPKDTKFPAPKLTAHRTEHGVRIEAAGSVVDLFVWDPSDRVQFLDNFVTLPAGGSIELRATGEVAELNARSLAGAVTLL